MGWHCHDCGRHCANAAYRSSESRRSKVFRENNASLLGVDPSFLNSPRLHGTVYDVAVGRNYDGHKAGTKCVVKWVRSDHTGCDETNHFLATRRTCHVAADMISAFSKQTCTRGYTILLNKPNIWKCNSDASCGEKKVLVEPYLSNFQKLNSNSGWVKDSPRTYEKVAHALSHFSHAWSGGKMLLCDLQGAVVDYSIILSDPAIHSTHAGQFGCSDLGKDGIRNFMQFHKCNGMCSHLPLPEDRKILFHPVQSTRICHGS